jgi:hypothetical protein
MNDLSVLLYFIMFAVVVGMTFAFMYSMMKSTLREFDKPRNVHPEMEDVKSGETLLVFSTEEEDDDDDGDVIIVRK